jgi:metal-dependent hydrolase (beta-lactamase superfamily II)
LKELNVVSVVPAHCTGDLAQKLFREAYGEEYDTGGAGKRVVLE